MAVASVFSEGQLAEKSSYTGSCSLPYVSGLFYLREGPFVTEAARRLRIRPQLLCFDAHGAAHPRSAGLATVCGMVLGIPSIGMAKSLLVGAVAPPRKGDNPCFERIVYEGTTVGFVTKARTARTYWSAGYSINLRELKSIIRENGAVCLHAMSESDRVAREQIRAL